MNMPLTQQDLRKIKQVLEPEFDKVEDRIKKSLKPEFDKVENRIRKALQPEFAKVKSDIKKELQPEFRRLERKIDNLRKENRQDHNMIINVLDKADIQLKESVAKIENRLSLTPLSSVL